MNDPMIDRPTEIMSSKNEFSSLSEMKSLRLINGEAMSIHFNMVSKKFVFYIGLPSCFAPSALCYHLFPFNK
jgi:hypothetical protein